MLLVSWNLARVQAHWDELTGDPRIDLALVQEAVSPAAGAVRETIPAPTDSWVTSGGKRMFCAAIARLSDRVHVKVFPTKPLGEAGPNDLGVSRPGTIAACRVTSASGEEFVVASIYAAWDSPLPWRKSGNYADASVHRLISDLSVLITSQFRHRIILAGDLNILFGHRENGEAYWRARYETIFTRMEAIGLPLVGPQHPFGEQATTPWPKELPFDSKNVPTFRTNRRDPATATRQLDFVFASRALHSRLTVRARNRAEDWGPCDHCRIEIEVQPR